MSAGNLTKIFRANTISKLGNKSLTNPQRNLSNSIVPVVIPIHNYWVKYFKKRLLIDYTNIYRRRLYSTIVEEELVDSNTFERVCEETLDSLAEYFDELIANEPTLEKGDIIYGAGVLTVDLANYGTYVINRQSPNRQIWLSSPTSGPKRYDYSMKEDSWIYKHDGKTLHNLLKNEISILLDKDLDISKCSHSKL